MPTYDYRCDACGHEFEKVQSMTEKLIRKCPECGKLSLKRLFGTGGGIIFKGSGFYETDYKRKPEPKKASEGPAPSGSGQGDGSSKPPAPAPSGSSPGDGGSCKTPAPPSPAKKKHK